MDKRTRRTHVMLSILAHDQPSSKQLPDDFVKFIPLADVLVSQCLRFRKGCFRTCRRSEKSNSSINYFIVPRGEKKKFRTATFLCSAQPCFSSLKQISTTCRWQIADYSHLCACTLNYAPPLACGFHPFFCFLRSLFTAEGPLTQGCCTGQPPGTDCFYTRQS